VAVRDDSLTWLALYKQAADADTSAAGYYNRNVGLPTPQGKVNVRIPLPGADVMDIRLWPEEDVLARIAPCVPQAPALLHVSEDPRFQVHAFLKGRVLDGFRPRGDAVPPHVMDDVVTLMTQLATIPGQSAPPLPAGWPADGDSKAFGRMLAGLTQRIYDAHLEEYGSVFTAFGIPRDPLAAVARAWQDLTPRPFALLHADLHRKNMIVHDGRTWFLDWELALWGDPMYEIAIHFHKMDYPDDQLNQVLRHWRARMPPTHTTGPDTDLYLYWAHERIKSAVVDTIRYSKQLRDADRPEQNFLIGRLARKLNAAHRVWGSAPNMTPERVAAALAPWTGR
jgi:aminoglycoside phosphotransferase (APT) family kinase protein